MRRAGFRPAEIRLEAEGTLHADAPGCVTFLPRGAARPWIVLLPEGPSSGDLVLGLARDVHLQGLAVNPPGDPPRVRPQGFRGRGSRR
ncbi:MAG: hypothetical protein L0216_12230 [Planctomycetales bacterium]|nr:hypothetical protein [Planctomycetales bacterium]